jgi:3-isopropylmalate/(R)-2-methylmalate dehydratase small subunit
MPKAHVYRRDHINTDEIIPARYLNTDDAAELAQHLMEDLDTEFVTKCQPGDVIVSGNDFGCGSSREHAVWAIQGAKVGAVIAHTFARIFYRNCINCGFYPIELDNALDNIQDGDHLDIDYEAGIIHNRTQDAELRFTPLPDFAIAIVKDGGLLPHIKKVN